MLFRDADGAYLTLIWIPPGDRDHLGRSGACRIPGAASGMGYIILNTRDRVAYDELTATIVVIGLSAFALDAAARLAIASEHAGDEAEDFGGRGDDFLARRCYG